MLFSLNPSLFWELRDKRNFKIYIFTRKPRNHVRILKFSEHCKFVRLYQLGQTLQLKTVTVVKLLKLDESPNIHLFCLTWWIIQVKKQRFAPMKRCIFEEEITSEGYSQYKSARYPQWYIGFSKGGRARSGSVSAKRQIYRHFTPRPLGKRKHRREAKIRKIIKLLKKTLHRRTAWK